MPLRDAISSGKKNVTQTLTGKKGEQLTVSSVCTVCVRVRVCVCVCVCACRLYLLSIMLNGKNNGCLSVLYKDLVTINSVQ